MKKYLLTVILALTVLLVGCESGLKIKDQITTVFTTEDRAKFTGEYIPYLKSEAAKHGYIVNEPILNTDVVMEAVVTESSTGDTATFRLAVDNGEYLWTIEYREDGKLVDTDTETYADMATWLFCVTHDIETRYNEGQSYDIMYIEEGANHLNGYLFNKSTLSYDNTKKLTSVDLWPGTYNWKRETVYSVSGSGEVVEISEYDSNDEFIQSRYKITWYVNDEMKDAIGVSDNNNTWKVYIPTTFTSDLSIEGAILVYENAWTENGGYSKSYDLNGELISESTYDGNGNLISTETYRSTKSASKAKQVASPVTTVNNIEEIQKMLTQNVKKGW